MLEGGEGGRPAQVESGSPVICVSVLLGPQGMGLCRPPWGEPSSRGLSSKADLFPDTSPDTPRNHVSPVKWASLGPGQMTPKGNRDAVDFYFMVYV